MKFCRPHPRKEAFDLEAVPQYRRFVLRELTKDQLMLNLRALQQKHGLEGFLEWDFWRQGGYVLPWDREQEVGAPGVTGSQGGTR